MFSDLIDRLFHRHLPVEPVAPSVPYSLNPRAHGRGNKTSASKRKRMTQHVAHESRRRNFQAS